MNEYTYDPQRSTEIVSQPRYELDATIHKWMFNNDEVLKEVERFAVQEGCSALHLLPSPLDESTSRDSLTRWYSKRGYKAHPKAPEEMIKSF